MNNSMNWARFAVFLAAIGFSTLAMAAVQVGLQVSGSKLVVISNNAQCAGGPIDCIDVQKGTKPNLFFNLNGACGNSGPAYKLTAFRIGLQNKVWPTPSTALPTDVADDFGANPHTVYYEVTAAHCTDMTAPDIHLDPQIKNRG